MKNCFKLSALFLLLSFSLNLTADEYYKDGVRKKSTDIFRTWLSEDVPYRIPAIAKTQSGNLVAVADYRFCRADIGYGHIDLHCRISEDNGKTWGDVFTDLLRRITMAKPAS